MAAEPMNRRAAYVAGLRALADLIEANPVLPMPLDSLPISIYATDKTTARRALAVVEAAGITGRKVTIDPAKADYGFDLDAKLHGLRLRLVAHARDVCTATGTTTVLTWAYEPAQTPALPAALDSSPEAADVPPTAAPGEPQAVDR